MSDLESFAFQNPVQLFYGKDAVEKLVPVIKEKKVLLLYGSKSIKENGVYDRVTNNLKKKGIEWVEVSGVQPNPSIEKVREAVTVVKDGKNGVEAILAVGGGSVIDSAKAIAFGRYYDGDTWDLFLKPERPNEHLPLYTILTLSATASEFDGGGVVSNKQLKLKLGGLFAFPIASAVDPTIQYSLPWRQIMCGAVDSLSHVMENYFSPLNESIVGKEVNLSIQRSIIKSADVLVKDPNNYDGRTSFCFAIGAALSGYHNVGLKGGDFNVHAIEHAISAYDDKIAHGEGLAVISLAYYPYIYKHLPQLKPTFELWAERLYGTTDVDAAFAAFREMYARWKTPATLKDLHVPKDGVEEIVKLVEEHSKYRKPSCIFPLNNDHVRAILTLASGY